MSKGIKALIRVILRLFFLFSIAYLVELYKSIPMFDVLCISAISISGFYLIDEYLGDDE